MFLEKINFSKLILEQYAQSWFIWIGFFIVGILLVKYAKNIATTRREINRIESAGAGLISISAIVHFGVIWALFND